jgi:hypothetical protein
VSLKRRVSQWSYDIYSIDDIDNIYTIYIRVLQLSSRPPEVAFGGRDSYLYSYILVHMQEYIQI